MKFYSNLNEATLLKRTLRFLAEVSVKKRQKLMLRCPNLGHILGCDTLGTRIWYSDPIGYNCLPTWELVEVDGGHLVCINPEFILPVVIEAIKKNLILEFTDCNILHTSSKMHYPRYHNLILEKDGKNCYVGLEHVTLGDYKKDGYFPDAVGVGLENLDHLINLKKAGNEVFLFYCVMHTGIDSIKPANHIDANYKNKLLEAVRAGVEIIAYKTNISLQGIEIITNIPVLLSEDITS